MSVLGKSILALTVGLTGAVAASSGQAQDKCEPFVQKVDMSTRVAQFVDHDGDGPSVGDRRIANVVLTNEAGEEIGVLDAVATHLHTDANGQVRMQNDNTMTYPGGVILYRVVPHLSTLDFADESKIANSPTSHRIILGGSGIFTGATGTIESTVEDDGGRRMVIKISCP